MRLKFSGSNPLLQPGHSLRAHSPRHAVAQPVSLLFLLSRVTRVRTLSSSSLFAFLRSPSILELNCFQGDPKLVACFHPKFRILE